MQKPYLLLLALFVTCCVGHAKEPAITPQNLEDMTVSLVSNVVVLSLDKDMNLQVKEERMSTCSGVWVSPKLILTANHCVDELNMYDEVNIESHDGSMHVAQFVDRASDADLALLRVDDPFVHPYAAVGREPLDGDVVQAVGHPHPDRRNNLFSLDWTYERGVVSSRRDGEMQMQMNGYPGMSGGGIFNKDGALVGIMRSGYPMTSISFAVGQPSVQEFLNR